MSSKAIHEYDAKMLLSYWLQRAPAVADSSPISPNFVYPSPNVAQIKWESATKTITPDASLPPWVFTSKLVAKPDQLIKRRGKSGLLLLNRNWSDAKTWITERAGKPVKVRGRGPNVFLTFSHWNLSYRLNLSLER
jgi:ATP citrate (pro-S)-lyase